MTNTRRASSDSPFRQERYASSIAYETGLLCNLVAKRCQVLDNPEDRTLILFLQQLSHCDGGLKKVASELLEMFPERLGTASMHRFGMKPRGKYSTDQVTAIRDEIPFGEHAYPLYGEDDNWRAIDRLKDALDDDPYSYNLKKIEREEAARRYPKSYPVINFLNACENAADNLADHLMELCVDPRIDLSDPKVILHSERLRSAGVWYFKDLIGTLHQYRLNRINQAKGDIAGTEIAAKVHEDLDFMLQSNSLVVIEGETRTGKTTSAENWCRQHPGRAVLIKLESGSDEKTFFRSIARALGTACSSQLKTAEMRVKIEDALQDGYLAVVFDEAHFLWPQTNRVSRAPSKVDWVRTALVDHGVPVALVSTPQFDKGCELLEKRVGWNANQIRGRVKLHTRLPDSLSDNDLNAIAKKLMPEADNKSLKLLLGFALASDDYVAGIERIVCRSRFFAHRRGDKKASTKDVVKAIEEVLPMPSRKASKKPSPKPVKKNNATRKHSFCRDGARPMHTTFSGPTEAHSRLPESSRFGANSEQKTPALSGRRRSQITST